jgi:hypothetical protein
MMNDLRKVAQEQSTDTKSAIGGTRMSEAATPAVAAGNRVSTTRIVGGAGVALAASVAVQNAVFVGTGAPAFGDPLGEVLAYHAENRGAVAVAVGQEAVNLPLLLLFVTGLHGLVQRRGGAGADWSRLAVAAGATLSAVFALVMTTHIAVVLAADGLAEPTPAFELVWQLHAAAFALALPALGATFIGAALATHASGLTRPWQRLLGVAGGSLLILAGAGNLAIADGSPLLFVGVAGYAAWLVWLVVTGLRLIRGQG